MVGGGWEGEGGRWGVGGRVREVCGGGGRVREVGGGGWVREVCGGGWEGEGGMWWGV